MTASPEQVDLARALVMLADRFDGLTVRLRQHAAGLIVGWASADQADALAAVLDETARQVRLWRPDFVVDARSGIRS